MIFIKNTKGKIILFLVVFLLLLIGIFLFLKNPAGKVPSPGLILPDYKNATYRIDGQLVILKDGVAEVAAAPGSASKIITRYFGNEAKTDLNGDGKEDVVFLLTQETGGSGTFFYVVAAVQVSGGYEGSTAYFLGDRIAPQTTEIQNGIIFVNYAERAPTDPMSAAPSVGKSLRLTFNSQTMEFIPASEE